MTQQPTPNAVPHLARLTWRELEALLLCRDRPVVALVAVGSVEPHGPHLPLGTDTTISEAAMARAGALLLPHVQPVIAPSFSYGVTECARGFAGAVSVPAPTLTALLAAIVNNLLLQGFAHVCLVNNHLEPAHDEAVRAALSGIEQGRASVACPLTRRWARQLSDEFKRGECHAGAYETSLVLAASPESCRQELLPELREVKVSLSKKLQEGIADFKTMGLAEAYCGSPCDATVAEGDRLLDVLATMIASEVLEAVNLSDGKSAVAPATPKSHAQDARSLQMSQLEMKTYRNKSELDVRYYGTLKQMMESQAYRELAAAQMFGYGLQYVPELRWLKFMTWHIREEMEHYEVVVKMYRELVGESVEPVVQARLAQKPIAFAASWFELAMAQFLYDRGGFWQLREYEQCSFEPYRHAVGKILKEEAGHQDLGERIVVELCRSGRFEADKQAMFDKWLRQGLLSFGRPNTDGSRYAISVGLKKRDAGPVMQDFLDDIKPAVKACGLVIPPASQLGIEGAEHLDRALDGVDESRAQGYA